MFTVHYMGWDGLRNGALLAKAVADGFEALVTMDSGIQYQQNIPRLPIALIVLKAVSNDMRALLPLVKMLCDALAVARAGTVIEIS